MLAHVTCPICLEPFTDAHCVATCGHTFCHGCASAALDAAAAAPRDGGADAGVSARCPTCSSMFTSAQLVPNAAVNAMVAAMKSGASEAAAASTSAEDGEDDLERLTPLVKTLSEKHRSLVLESRAVSREVLKEFLVESRARKQASAVALERELRCLDADIDAVRREIEALGGGARVSHERSDLHDKEVIAHAMEALGLTRPGESQIVIDESKRRRVLRQFSELQSWYSKRRSAERDDVTSDGGKSSGSALNGGRGYAPDSTTMEEFSTIIDTFKRYSNISIAAEIRGEEDASNPGAPVSSIEFDSTQEYFATAGVSKRIQFYNLEHVLEGSQQPADEINTRSKLTCLSYNKFVKHHIAASDYEGVVSVWDVEKKCSIIDFEEHEKRIWTVDYCRTDPRLLVSGSDDYLVKIWNTDQPNSVHEIDMKANVCCAQYSPENAHCIAVGCVDQKVYIFDLRRLAEPVQILDSHRKAVSYVKYLNANEIASASTDNTINVWNVNTGELTCALKGHVNERNFVGLTAVGDHVACGSETNEVFIYRKDLSSPIASIGFARDANEPRGFISACAWRSDESVLVAANSNGVVKVLRV
jgi:E3 ubiquitin-protein ligase RFWD2